MLKYINSWILKGDSDDNASVDPQNSKQSHKRMNSDPWTSMVFPSYLDYETLEEKLTKADAMETNKTNQSSIGQTVVPTPGRIGWNAFVPSNWPTVTTQMNSKRNDTNTGNETRASFPIYPPMDPSKHVDWAKLLPHGSSTQHTKS